MNTDIYTTNHWRVYRVKINGRYHYFIGRVNDTGYYWVSPTKKHAIQIADAAEHKYFGGENNEI